MSLFTLSDLSVIIVSYMFSLLRLVHIYSKCNFLPPAYVVRREGTVFTGVCLSTGGGGGVRSSWGGWVRSSRGGAGLGQVQPGGRSGSGPAGGRGGSGPARGEGWVRSSRGGGVGQVQLGGRGGSGPAGGVGQVQLGGGVGQVQPGGRGGSGPAGGGGVGQVQPGGRGGSGPAGGVGQVQLGGGVGQVQPGGRGGSGPAGGGGVGPGPAGGEGVGQVQPGGRGGSDPAGGEGWVRSSRGGGVGQVQPGGEGWVRSSRGGSAKIAQHRKYFLHGGRYASCVHAGGLSCSFYVLSGTVLCVLILIFTGKNFHVMSLNVNGLRDFNRRKHILSKYLFQSAAYPKPDIICLQESHLEKIDELGTLALSNFDMCFAHSKSDSGGLITGFNRRLDYSVSNHAAYSYEKSQILVVECMIHTIPYVIVNVYANQADQLEDFFKLLYSVLEPHKSSNILICGDFNVPIDLSKDITGTRSSRIHSRNKAMINFLGESQLRDVWRLFNPITRKFTVFNSRKESSRIDYILATDSLINSLEHSEIGIAFKADHCPVYLTISIRNPPGKGYWKFPNFLLGDPKFKPFLKRQDR